MSNTKTRKAAARMRRLVSLAGDRTAKEVRQLLRQCERIGTRLRGLEQRHPPRCRCVFCREVRDRNGESFAGFWDLLRATRVQLWAVTSMAESEGPFCTLAGD